MPALTLVALQLRAMADQNVLSGLKLGRLNTGLVVHYLVALIALERADRVRAHSQPMEQTLEIWIFHRWPQTASDPITWTPGARSKG